mmetsp:Transcript_3410/g.11763  ORF Transcript_3410/g.11763 Transcript_3410/m.11763 type:complete len:262 (-) Transcript_3410:1605-2390(-)
MLSSGVCRSLYAPCIAGGDHGSRVVKSVSSPKMTSAASPTTPVPTASAHPNAFRFGFLFIVSTPSPSPCNKRPPSLQPRTTSRSASSFASAVSLSRTACFNSVLSAFRISAIDRNLTHSNLISSICELRSVAKRLARSKSETNFCFCARSLSVAARIQSNCSLSTQRLAWIWEMANLTQTAHDFAFNFLRAAWNFTSATSHFFANDCTRRTLARHAANAQRPINCHLLCSAVRESARVYAPRYTTSLHFRKRTATRLRCQC